VRANQLRLWFSSMASCSACFASSASNARASPGPPADQSAWLSSRSAPWSPPACGASSSQWLPAVPANSRSERPTPGFRQPLADETDSA
jgi:hypothetical protein